MNRRADVMVSPAMTALGGKGSLRIVSRSRNCLSDSALKCWSMASRVLMLATLLSENACTLSVIEYSNGNRRGNEHS